MFSRCNVLRPTLTERRILHRLRDDMETIASLCWEPKIMRRRQAAELGLILGIDNAIK